MARDRFISWVTKNLPRMPQVIQREAIKDWNQNTLEALSKAKTKTPQTTAQSLLKSMDRIKAKITKNGIVSAIVARVPYAHKIHSGYDEKNETAIRLKDPGELSYYIWGGGHRGKKRGVRRGQAQYKIIKGEEGFISKGINETANMFISDLKKNIGNVWREL